MASTTVQPWSVPSLHERRRAPQGQLLALASALADPVRRLTAARNLAQFVGAEDLVIFIFDPDVQATLPAPGFPQTLPNSDAWSAFLDACIKRGSALAALSFPGFQLGTTVRGVAGEGGSVVALVAGDPSPQCAADLALLLPLITAALAGEFTTLAAEGHAAIARESAVQANLLAASLDDARSALQDALAGARSASAAKDHFLAVLSHELRTPLTPILVTASLLESDPRIPADLQQDIQAIRRNAELETRLIDDLLDVTRISRGKLELHRADVQVHRLLDQTLDMYRGDIHQKRLDLILQFTATGQIVHADPARLQQVFWNIIKNAVKFTPSRGRITVETRNDEEGHILIAFHDTGIGLEPSLQPRIFDAFEQGDPAIVRQFGGLGLGLSISKVLVELHGGTITGSSEGRELGTTFTVTLPTVSPAPRKVAHVRPAPDAAAARRLRILLVEDHEATARIMSRLLQSFGHDVRAAATVNAALEAAASERFDLVISDVGLPDGTGLELMRELRQTQPVPGIALTGYGMEEDIRESAAAGFAEHLTKPVEPGRLRAAIERLS